MTTFSLNDAQNAWQKFVCMGCGHVYDESCGEPKSDISAGTRFADIADDWSCPLCGVKKSGFTPYEEDKTADVVTAMSGASRGVVVIGGGLAGWSVVEAIRALDKEVPVTLIADDNADRYHKPMLSVAISQGKRPKDLVRTTAEDAATTLNIRVLAKIRVIGIDAGAKLLDTTNGQVAYDDLVLAVGACPVYPASIAHDMAWHVNSLEKFAEFQQRLDSPKHIAIVGAGMVGTELAEDLVNAGHQVSLIATSEYPLSNLLPGMAGERVLDAIKGIGVNWLGGCGVEQIQRNAEGCQLTLSNATADKATLVADEVVVATGLMVDAQLPVSAGVDFDEKVGIAVDSQTLQTSVPHIYAIGDCIAIDGVPCRYVMPHRAQAAAIAQQILGQDGAYSHKAPMIRLKNKSISVTATGSPRGAGEWQVMSDADGELILQMMDQGQAVATATLKRV